MSQSAANINSLFKNAQNEGSLSPEAIKTLSLVDIGAQIQNSLGISALDVQASEVVLVTQLIDDSGSIMAARNEQVVRDGHNMVIDALNAAKQKDGILMHTRYLNGKILFQYCPIQEAIRMDNQNYNANGGTPLFDQTVVTLGAVLAKAQEFAENGVSVRTVTLITSDGHDEHSTKIRQATQVAPIVRDMGENHIIAAMGIDDGRTDFRQIYTDMGINPKWILLPKNSQKEIRAAFSLFSSSAVRASQSAAHFSQTALSGFTK